MTKEFLPIRTKTISGESPLLFEPYVLLGERYVRFAAKGLPPEMERFQRLKKDGIKKLYILAEEETDYLTYLDSMFAKVMASKDKPVEERAVIIRDAAVSTAEEALSEELTEQSFKVTQNTMGALTKFLTEEELSLGKTLGLESDRTIYQHSLNVAALSVTLAQRMGLNDAEKLTTLSMAGLFHDIGRTKLSFDPLTPIEKLTPEQMTEYKSHPLKGKEELANKPFIHPGIIDIIVRHEERIDGKGYPGGLKKKDLNLEAQIIAMCNVYDRYFTLEGLSFSKALAKMTKENIKGFDLDLFRAFQQLLKDQQMEDAPVDETSGTPPPQPTPA